MMDEPKDELIPTRATLLLRLKDWQDQASWQDFFDTYWRLIYNVAVKRGLTGPEAEEVVQQTMISVARHMPGFRYDPALGSFKAWLLNMTRWRIADHLRRNQSQAELRVYQEETMEDFPGGPKTDVTGQYTLPELEKIWDEEWEKNLLEAAITKARRRLDPKQFQIFDCYVKKGWPPERVAKAFGISLNQVYLAKHRMTALIKEEVERIQKEVI